MDQVTPPEVFLIYVWIVPTQNADSPKKTAQTPIYLTLLKKKTNIRVLGKQHPGMLINENFNLT